MRCCATAFPTTKSSVWKDCLCADAEARRHYVSFMHLSAKLCRWNSANTAQAGDLGMREEVTGGGQAGVGRPTVNDDFPAEITAAGNAGPPHPAPSALLHGFSFVNSAILSYAAFGLIMGAVGSGNMDVGRAVFAPSHRRAPGGLRGRRAEGSDCRPDYGDVGLPLGRSGYHREGLGVDTGGPCVLRAFGVAGNHV